MFIQRCREQSWDGSRRSCWGATNHKPRYAHLPSIPNSCLPLRINTLAPSLFWIQLQMISRWFDLCWSGHVRGPIRKEDSLYSAFSAGAFSCWWFAGLWTVEILQLPNNQANQWRYYALRQEYLPRVPSIIFVILIAHNVHHTHICNKGILVLGTSNFLELYKSTQNGFRQIGPLQNWPLMSCRWKIA